MKQVRYAIEAIVLALCAGIFWILPLDVASALGGWLGRTIGPRMAASRKAMANLALAFPGKSESERAEIARGMWDNLGRVMAEYPHLPRIIASRTEIMGQDIFDRINNDGKSGIVFGGHLANWEIVPTLLGLRGSDFHAIYREPNNPWSAKLLDLMRSKRGNIPSIAKSFSGTREMVKVMKDNNHIIILIDQKYNEGLPIPFFGHPAMTSSAFVQLSQKFDAPLVPLRIERIAGARFRATFLPPMDIAGKPAEFVMNDAHRMLESWITERPAQWLWLHRRWPKSP